MSLLPDFTIGLGTGWWFSLIYLIVNLGIPFVKKDAFKRLFKSPKSHEKFWEAVIILNKPTSL